MGFSLPVEIEDLRTVESQDIQTVNKEADQIAIADDGQASDAESRREKKRWIMILISAVIAALALFVFFLEVGQTRGTQTERLEITQYQPRSVIQDEISDLDWIIPAFLPINRYSRPGDRITEVNAIVIHYIGNPSTTAQQNRNYFANLAMTGETYASSNFIICLNGEILQCIPVDEIAYASNVRNADTLSIELCHPDTTGQFTEETYEAAVRLTAWLCSRYGLAPDDIIRHYDVTGKECPMFFVEDEDAWATFKTDVGIELRMGMMAEG